MVGLLPAVPRPLERTLCLASPVPLDLDEPGEGRLKGVGELDLGLSGADSAAAEGLARGLEAAAGRFLAMRLIWAGKTGGSSGMDTSFSAVKTSSKSFSFSFSSWSLSFCRSLSLCLEPNLGLKALGLSVEVLGLGVDPPCNTSRISPTVSFSVVVVAAVVVVPELVGSAVVVVVVAREVPLMLELNRFLATFLEGAADRSRGFRTESALALVGTNEAVGFGGAGLLEDPNLEVNLDSDLDLVTVVVEEVGVIEAEVEGLVVSKGILEVVLKAGLDGRKRLGLLELRLLLKDGGEGLVFSFCSAASFFF